MRVDVIMVIAALALVSLLGVGGMLALSYAGKSYDTSLVALVSACAGALASMLARTKSGEG